MKLEGSCHCGSVRFSVESAEPCPFMRCYCSICRKTAGSGGYAINLGADFRTLRVTGKRRLRRSLRRHLRKMCRTSTTGFARARRRNRGSAGTAASRFTPAPLAARCVAKRSKC